MKLFIIRHGESVGNVKGIIQGQLDLPLSERGIDEAKKLAEYLKGEKIHKIYSSDISRALQTANYIAQEQNLNVIVDPIFREAQLGRFQGLTHDEINQEYPDHAKTDWMTSGLHDVEQINQVYERALKSLNFILNDMRTHEQVILVSHGGYISSILAALLKIKWTGKKPFAIRNTSISIIDFSDPMQFVIEVINETPHLSKDMRIQQSKVIDVHK